VQQKGDIMIKNTDDVIRVLQVGLAKSGNYWVYSILKQCLQQAGLPHTSFIQQQPIHGIAQSWDLSYEEQADIDVLDITNSGCFYCISSIFRHPVTDLDAYLQDTTHVWTHSRFCDACREVFSKFDKVVHIIRDPRDAALSHARFMLTPYMKTYYPNDIESKQEYLETRLESKLRRWVEHVAPYLARADELDMHVVFYERFLLNFASELDRLLEYLDLSLDTEDRRAVEEAVTFQSMKEKDPEHVQKGKAAKWRDQMSDEQKQRSRKITGPLLEKLDYPLRNTTDDICPSVPKTFTPDEAKDMIERAKHPYLEDKLKKRIRTIYRTVFS
jgi:aryl sulfotransferase